MPKETPVDKLKRYTIKDNNSFGEWSYDDLANEWDAEELDAWGLDTPDTFGIAEAAASTISVTEEILARAYTPLERSSLEYEETIERDDRYDGLNELVDSMPDGDIKKIAEKRLSDFEMFRFDVIADYYSYGASKEEKEVFEKLGLVFVTTEKAIRDGFAKIDDLL